GCAWRRAVQGSRWRTPAYRSTRSQIAQGCVLSLQRSPLRLDGVRKAAQPPSRLCGDLRVVEGIQLGGQPSGDTGERDGESDSAHRLGDIFGGVVDFLLVDGHVIVLSPVRVG